MDRVRIEKEWKSWPFDINFESIAFAEHIAKIARAEALEDAAKICDKSGNEPSSLWEEEGCWKHASCYCAEQIRVLKEKS